MKAVHDRVIVRVNMAQKDKMIIAGIIVSCAQKYQINHREKSPVIAEVVEGNRFLATGDFILCHHNHFYPPSPYFLQDDLYSIPANHTIFAKLLPDGELEPVYGNVLAHKVEIESILPIPVEHKTYHKNRGKIIHGGWTKFKPGDLVFTRPSAPYDIVYIFGDIEKRVTKINGSMICAVVKKRKLQ